MAKPTLSPAEYADSAYARKLATMERWLNRTADEAHLERTYAVAQYVERVQVRATAMAQVAPPEAPQAAPEASRKVAKPANGVANKTARSPHPSLAEAQR